MISRTREAILKELSREDTPKDEELGIDISIVIPVFNEEDNLETLYSQLKQVLEGVGKTYEIILVDDGSTDSTFYILERLHKRDSHVWVIRFRRNFGQSAAFSAGFEFAKGNIIVTMDADLQNDPADIPRLLDKLEEGYDVISGWRVDRKDSFLTRQVPSRIANFLISMITGVKLHDYGCSLKVYRTAVVKNVRLYGEMHRFIPALASWMGIRIAELPVNHAPRLSGHSKYGIMRTIRVILDLLTVKFLLGYSTRPIQIFGFLGALSLFIGLILSAYLTTIKLAFNQPLRDRPLLLLAILLIIFGVQLITMGLLGELVIRNYYESQNKPTYMVKEVLGDGPRHSLRSKN